MNTRLKEIETRLAQISNEIDKASGETLTALENEVNDLTEERRRILDEIEKRNQLRNRVAIDVEPGVVPADGQNSVNENEIRARRFVETGRMAVSAAESRATLISGGTLLTPTEVSGINDIPGSKFSSIIDLVNVVNCEGMGSNKIAYVDSDMAEASTQTEGSTVSETKPEFNYVTILPESVLVLSQISKQVKKQTPLVYEAKVRAQALDALRKKAATIVTNALKNSTITSSVNATVSSGKGVINENTLRNIALAYGGDESVIGGAVLFLNKTDLIAFGDVRGSDKKPVYEITPDGSNPNTGTIKEGGVSVKYCINSKLTACSGTNQTSSPIKTMFYGMPNCIELDLFSQYEIKVSEDFAFDKLLDTIRGDVEAGAAVTVKNGFVAYTIPASA